MARITVDGFLGDSLVSLVYLPNLDTEYIYISKIKYKLSIKKSIKTPTIVYDEANVYSI